MPLSRDNSCDAKENEGKKKLKYPSRCLSFPRS